MPFFNQNKTIVETEIKTYLRPAAGFLLTLIKYLQKLYCSISILERQISQMRLRREWGDGTPMHSSSSSEVSSSSSRSSQSSRSSRSSRSNSSRRLRSEDPEESQSQEYLSD